MLRHTVLKARVSGLIIVLSLRLIAEEPAPVGSLPETEEALGLTNLPDAAGPSPFDVPEGMGVKPSAEPAPPLERISQRPNMDKKMEAEGSDFSSPEEEATPVPPEREPPPKERLPEADDSDDGGEEAEEEEETSAVKRIKIKDRFRLMDVETTGPTSVPLPQLKRGTMERYYGEKLVRSQEVYRLWDMNADGRHDFVQRIDAKGKVVGCYYDFDFDGKVDKDTC